MPVGIFGGTFDPVHVGHLRTALELKDFLGLDKMLLVPCGDPPHRERPMTPAPDRLAMVQLAIEGEPGLEADWREVDRPGHSFSIDTLIELRGELGSQEPICFCIGLDSLISLPHWHRWQEFLRYAHMVVAVRPGWTLPGNGPLRDWVDSNRVATPRDMMAAPGGKVLIGEMTLLPVSATDIRESLHAGESIRYLTPDPVIEYIRNHHLYMPS